MYRVSIAIILMTPIAVSAQDAAKTVKVTVSPAKAPAPALRYVLLPNIGDLRPGNAAYWYLRAASPESVPNLRRHPDYPKISDWLALPLSEFPRKKAEQFRLQRWSSEIDFAARHQQCDWHLIERLKKDGIALLLPDVQFFREYARFLAVRARLEILDGDYEKAIRTIQTGLALARHVADGPTLIHGLVGTAIGFVMLERVEDLIQQPDAPNLYWALTQLPRPFISFRKGFEAERLMAENLLPGIRKTLNNPDHPPMSNQHLQTIIAKLAQISDMNGFAPGSDQTFNRLFIAVAAAKMYPRAKQMLQSRGFSKRQIDRLPVVQVAFMQTLVEYDRIYDNSMKWVHLPYPQAERGLLKADEDLKNRVRGFSKNARIPFGELILPAIRSVVAARLRLDRHIAVLRQIEALRLYAETQGRFPTNLDKMAEETPLPIDPTTGKPIRYELVKPGEAVLILPPARLSPNARNSVRWEIFLRAQPKTNNK